MEDILKRNQQQTIETVRAMGHRISSNTASMLKEYDSAIQARFDEQAAAVAGLSERIASASNDTREMSKKVREMDAILKNITEQVEHGPAIVAAQAAVSAAARTSERHAPRWKRSCVE